MGDRAVVVRLQIFLQGTKLYDTVFFVPTREGILDLM